MLRRHSILLAAFVALLAQAASAQGALPTIDQVLSRYVQALGGRENILKISNRSMMGTFQMDGADRGTVEIYFKVPNLYHSMVSVDGQGVIDTGHDAAGGWEKGPGEPLKPVTGSELARSRRELDLHKALKLQQLFRSLTVKGKGKSGNRDTWLVVAVPADGYPETMYFDTVTGLLLRVDLQVDTDSGPTAVERYYEDYRTVDDVKIAHVIRFVNPGISYTLRFSSVRQNTAIEAAKLARPK